MLSRAVEGMMVISTGGSSGVARYTVMTYEEWDRFCDVQGAALELLGVGPNDRVANLFIAGSLWPSFIGVHEAIRRVGAVHLPISGNIPVESILRFCREFDPTVILSLPTAFVFLADHALKDGLTFPSLRLVGYGGEQMSAAAEAHVRRGMGPRDVVALGYSSGDAGLMGYQCPHCAPGVYHLPTAFQYLEIVDPLDRRSLPARPSRRDHRHQSGAAVDADPALSHRRRRRLPRWLLRVRRSKPALPARWPRRRGLQDRRRLHLDESDRRLRRSLR